MQKHQHKSENPYRVVRYSVGGMSRCYARMICICKHYDDIGLSKNLPPEIIIGKFEHKGWHKHGKVFVCRNCKEREKAKRREQHQELQLTQPIPLANLQPTPSPKLPQTVITSHQQQEKPMPEFLKEFDIKIGLTRKKCLLVRFDKKSFNDLAPLSMVYLDRPEISKDRKFRFPTPTKSLKIPPLGKRVYWLAPKIESSTLALSETGVSTRTSLTYKCIWTGKCYETVDPLASEYFTTPTIKQVQPNPSIIKGAARYKLQDGADLKNMFNDWLLWAHEQGHSPLIEYSKGNIRLYL